MIWNSLNFILIVNLQINLSSQKNKILRELYIYTYVNIVNITKKNLFLFPMGGEDKPQPLVL